MKKKQLMQELAREREVKEMLQRELAEAKRNTGLFRLLMKIGPRVYEVGSWWVGADEEGNPFIEVRSIAQSFTVMDGDTLRLRLPLEMHYTPQ
jgi:phosphoenolpyruvate carboxylase